MFYATLIYFYEIQWKLFYWLLSSIISFCILFWYYKIILLVNFYPLITYDHRCFVSLDVTELFSSIIVVILWVCCLILFDYSRFQISLFFSPVWFQFQTKIFNSVFKLFCTTYLILYFLVSLTITPKIINFFFLWGLKSKYALLQITTESRLNSHLFWVLSTNFFVSNTLSFSLLFIFWSVAFLGPFPIYYFIKNYKTQIIFAIFSVLSFFLFFDVFSQLFLLAILIFSVEIIIFLLAILISYSTPK